MVLEIYIRFSLNKPRFELFIYVFYDSKLYFWLMVEWMLFVFIIIHTEASKVTILEEAIERDRIQVELFMEDLQENPEKLKVLEDLRKKYDK